MSIALRVLHSAREIFTPLASDALVGKRVKKLLEELAALDA